MPRRTTEDEIKKHAIREGVRLLSKEIDSFRRKFPWINLSYKDRGGKTLEYRILVYMKKNLIWSFATGAYFYLERKLEEV